MEQTPQPQPEQPDPLEMAKLEQQDRADRRKHQIELLKLKKEYAEMESEELQNALTQAVELATEQEQPFRDALSKILESSAQPQQTGSQGQTQGQQTQ